MERFAYRPRMVRLLLATLGGATVAYWGCRAQGARRWNRGTRDLRGRLEATRRPMLPGTVDFRELENLPDPVRRYLQTVLTEGQPMVSGVRLRHAGTFNVGEKTDRWKHFTSDQVVVTRRPGFDWQARVEMGPGLPVLVHDAYVAGDGVLNASVLGLFTVADMRGGGELARGELMRFFAETAWYPTALLPSQGIHWEAEGGRSARATLTEGETSTSLLFTFDEQNLIEMVSTEARGRTVGDEVIQTPWRGKFWNYRERGGMLVPLDAEVAWVLPEGEKPYWRGHITDIFHEPARWNGHRRVQQEDGPIGPRSRVQAHNERTGA